jgi:hypothetical protein
MDVLPALSAADDQPFDPVSLVNNDVTSEIGKTVMKAATPVAKSVMSVASRGVGSATRAVMNLPTIANAAAGSLKDYMDKLSMSEDKEAEVEDLIQRIGPAPGAKSLAILLMSAPKEVQQEAVRAAELAAEEERCRQAVEDEEVRRCARARATRSVSHTAHSRCTVGLLYQLILVSSCVCVRGSCARSLSKRWRSCTRRPTRRSSC